MEKTAVDYLVKEIESKGDYWENSSNNRIQISILKEDYERLIEQAKEMEKQQIVEAYRIGNKVGFKDEIVSNGEQYYNETFIKE